MARLLFYVTDPFVIEGRGILLLPGIRPEHQERLRAGDAIRLKRPDGVDVQTTIGDFEMMQGNPTCESFVVLRELRQDEVPPGTQVWSMTME